MSDDELVELIQTLDDELIAEGAEPWQRELAMESRLSEKLRVSLWAPRIISNLQGRCGHEKAAEEAAQQENLISTIVEIV